MPDWISVIILGLIEGITEFLPVSSTGHLLIAEQWIRPEIARTELFNIVVQCGAVIAVLAVFSKRALAILSQWREPAQKDYLIKLSWAFLITAAGGLFVKKVLHWKLPHDAYPIALASLIGGVVILIIERWIRGRPTSDTVSWNVATVVGCAQLLAAVFPGTSRSGACILFALMLGLARPAATEFSFLLGIPTMFAASALEILSSIKNGEAQHLQWGLVGLGTLTAFVSAFIVVKWLLRFVQSHTFNGFGYYRIALGILLIALLGKGGH